VKVSDGCWTIGGFDGPNTLDSPFQEAVFGRGRAPSSSALNSSTFHNCVYENLWAGPNRPPITTERTENPGRAQSG